MRYDHFSMLPERAFQPRGRFGMTLEGSSPGGPTSSTVTQTNIPEWLRPQTEALLGAATKEYFQTREVPGKPAKYDEAGNEISPAEKSTYEITGVKPFTPYSTRPEDYFAGFSPLQQQAQFEAANMQRPAGFDYGAQLVGQAGMGGMRSAEQALGYGGAGYGIGQMGQQLGTQGGGYYGGMGAGYGAQAAGMAPEAQRYGRLGAGYGAQAAGLAPEAQQYGRTAADIGQMGLQAQTYGRDVGEEARGFARQAAGAGQQYAGQATSPAAMQAYMSPYMQNVVDVQKQAALLDAQKAQLAANLAAPKMGTAGGSRQALMTAERERGLQTQMANIQAQGLQKAYEDAQRAQQFGANLGLQGLQGAQAGLGTALQGGQLGLSGIGQAMAGQQAGLAGLGQAGQLYGQGMQGAGMGLQGLGQAGQLYGQGIQGAGMGLQGVQQQLAGTAQGMQGAGLGLSGVSGAQAGYGLTGAQGVNMANIANQMQGADIGRMQFQRGVGAEERDYQQALINQAIQNYAQGQQSPFERLSGYNALLRGYYTPTTTTQSYMAPPSAMSQIAGAGMTGAAMYGLAKKKGGKIKEKDGAGIDDLMIQKTMKKVAA